MKKEELEYSSFFKQFSIGEESLSSILRRIVDFEESHSKDETTDFYVYILNNINNFKILTEVVKLSNSYQSPSILSKLLDILLMKNITDKNNDDILNLRVLAIKSIARYKDTSTLGTLLYCLNNKNENYKIRLSCADALGRIGDKYAVASLINVVKDDDEKSIYVKESATFALGMLGDSTAIEPLVCIMEAKQGLWGKFSFLKERIVEALGKLNINNKNVLKVLKNALYDSSSMVRINAIEALMNSEYEEAYDLIYLSLQDEDDEVKRNALIALYNMRGRDILDEVISLPSFSEYLKVQAKEIINEYEDN